MRNSLFVLTMCVCSSLFADEKITIEIIQKSEQSIYEGKLECQKALSTGSFQDCWLKLFRAGEPVEKIEIFIAGGMPVHEHGLPTSPKINWSDDKKAYVIEGLKFSMPGKWILNFKINHSDVKFKDQIIMSIEVKD